MTNLAKAFSVAAVLAVIAVPALAHRPMAGLGHGRFADANFGPGFGRGHGANAQSQNIDHACMANALQAKFSQTNIYEDQLRASRLTFQNALVAAWQLNDASARQNAIKSAHEAFRTATKPARDAMRTSNQTFKDEVRACEID